MSLFPAAGHARGLEKADYVILRGGTPHRGSEWVDLDTRPLEDQLAEIAHEVALRSEAAEHSRHADEQAQETAQQNRENALRLAYAAHAHAYRVQHLGKQTDAWHEAKRLAEFVTAVRDHTASLPPGQEKTEIEEWLRVVPQCSVARRTTCCRRRLGRG
ncbi:hypothetical protein [Streptomyces rubiginosohelvolus]|uniref:hypothetical protein n=1 Tax=Streptomyces rubiginosohelvolus TaxID=67362 RepID=UPI0035DDC552